MKKIISVFQRNYDGDHLVRDEITVGAEWVLAGEGVPTLKLDGTACLVRDGRLYKRFDAKQGKPTPPGFEPAQDAPDDITGHWPGWVLVGNGPEDRWHREAWTLAAELDYVPADGTYELIGPRVQGNPERQVNHVLVPHGSVELPDCPRTFDGIRAFLAAHTIEGIVFHHEDGRMAKITRKSFGLSWPVKP